VIVLVPQSDRLLADLRALDEEARAGLRVQRHPDQPATIAVLIDRTWRGDRAVEQLVRAHGRVVWADGRFRFEKPQLALPGLG
jgi:hypothetical protein